MSDTEPVDIDALLAAADRDHAAAVNVLDAALATVTERAHARIVTMRASKVIEMADALEAMLVRAQKAERELKALRDAVERLDDAYVNAEHYPAPVRAVVEMARGTH